MSKSVFTYKYRPITIVSLVAGFILLICVDWRIALGMFLIELKFSK